MTDGSDRKDGGGKTDARRRQFIKAGAAGVAAVAATMAAGGTSANTGLPGDYPWQEDGHNPRFTDRTVLITGATSGIGEATARAFAAEGARVMFCGRRKALGSQVEASIRKAGGEATYMFADVREEPLVEAFVKACLDTYGGLDIAFNNAGIAGPMGEFGDMPLGGVDGYHDVIATNLNGVYYAMRHEIPVMLEQGHGIIVNTASMLGSKGAPGIAPYSSTKHGVVGLTRSAAAQYAGRNLRINSISPGPIDTPLLRRGGNTEALARANPSGRIGRPEEVAAMVLTLSASEAGFVNGEDFRIDGASSA